MAKFPKSTSKITYRYLNCDFSPSEFSAMTANAAYGRRSCGKAERVLSAKKIECVKANVQPTASQQWRELRVTRRLNYGLRKIKNSKFY